MNQEQAFEALTSWENIFLTGKAWTGKTFLTQKFIEHLKANSKFVVVTAPTGIAALNIGGTTIHSAFKMWGSYPDISARPPRRQKIKWMHVDVLIIDEISMVSPDYLDYINYTLQEERGSEAQFGWLQVVVVGDLAQLPPVHAVFSEKDQTIMNMLQQKYGEQLSPDKAHCFKSFNRIELTEVKRQEDPKFIELLNKVREWDMSVLSQFNKGYGDEHTVHLRPFNKMVDAFNNNRMALLQGKQENFTAVITGQFDVARSITPILLQLKIGARVMVTANQKDTWLVNGDFGTVIGFLKNSTANGMEVIRDGWGQWVIIKVDRFWDREFEIKPTIWNQVEYEWWEETVIGTMEQIPLKLGWCMTIHKSQGLSLESVSVTITKNMARDLIYVALSRATTFEKLYVNHV